MSDDRLWKAPAIVPTLTYEDVPKAVEWLQRVFGFRERAAARLSWPGGGMTWLELEDGLVHVATPGHGLRSLRETGGACQSLKVYVADVDAHFARAKAAGATIVSEPEDGFWGGRIYRALDLEGHPFEFSQRDRELAADAWRLPPGVTRGV